MNAKYTRAESKRANAYHKAIANLNLAYARIERKYIHEQASGASMLALQHERNERLARLAQMYHERLFPFE